MQRDTGNIESVTVEYGFLDSTADDVSQLKNNWEDYAEAVVRAVTNYIGATYTPISDNYYVVKSGDSLWKIANTYNVSVNELKEINNLTSNNLSIGQVLKIPTEQEIQDTNTYIVKSGDSLWKIANQYNTSVTELKNLNNLTSNNLSIGQVLKLPQTEGINTNIYIVKSGDSLWKIANQYNTSVTELKNLNNLTSNNLSIGQVLKIPTEETNQNTYIVKSGDSLWSISKKVGMSVSELKELNNLTNNLLSIDQVLQIK